MVTIYFLTCQRCNHRWAPRKTDTRLCPRCKSARWDTPREPGNRQGLRPVKSSSVATPPPAIRPTPTRPSAPIPPDVAEAIAQANASYRAKRAKQKGGKTKA